MLRATLVMLRATLCTALHGKSWWPTLTHAILPCWVWIQAILDCDKVWLVERWIVVDVWVRVSTSFSILRTRNSPLRLCPTDPFTSTSFALIFLDIPHLSVVFSQNPVSRIKRHEGAGSSIIRGHWGEGEPGPSLYVTVFGWRYFRLPILMCFTTIYWSLINTTSTTKLVV